MVVNGAKSEEGCEKEKDELSKCINIYSDDLKRIKLEVPIDYYKTIFGEAKEGPTLHPCGPAHHTDEWEEREPIYFSEDPYLFEHLYGRNGREDNPEVREVRADHGEDGRADPVHGVGGDGDPGPVAVPGLKEIETSVPEFTMLTIGGVKQLEQQLDERRMELSLRTAKYFSFNTPGGGVVEGYYAIKSIEYNYPRLEMLVTYRKVDRRQTE